MNRVILVVLLVVAVVVIAAAVSTWVKKPAEPQEGYQQALQTGDEAQIARAWAEWRGHRVALVPGGSLTLRPGDLFLAEEIPGFPWDPSKIQRDNSKVVNRGKVPVTIITYPPAPPQR